MFNFKNIHNSFYRMGLHILQPCYLLPLPDTWISNVNLNLIKLSAYKRYNCKKACTDHITYDYSYVVWTRISEARENEIEVADEN
jgi:hypothetical protein